MKLFITNTPVDSMEGTKLVPDALNTNMAHVVICSRKWDQIFIDVDECIREGRLRLLHTRTDEIVPRLPTTPCSRHQMVLLTELFPDKAGSIRAAFLKGADPCGVLPSMWR